MKRFLILILITATMVVGVGAVAGGAYALGSRRDPIVTESLTRTAPKCGKDCRKLNDVFFKADGYTDYFVYDSDGKKDDVFAIYHHVPFPTAGEGMECDVIVKFESQGIAMQAVCPGPQVIAMGSASQSNNDEDNS